MLKTLAVSNYRSIHDLVIQLGRLNIITGLNASGKSNLYKALRLLADTAIGGVINALAQEGGLNSTKWAGPEKISSRMKSGEVRVQGTQSGDPFRLRLGFSDEFLGYAISLGIPPPSHSAFGFDPEIKRETIWAGDFYRPASVLVDRDHTVVTSREGRKINVIAKDIAGYETIFSDHADPAASPEIFSLREKIRNWRFYDHFRIDQNAPSRLPQLGSLTKILGHDGSDIASAIQTIREIGDREAFDHSIDTAFPGSTVSIVAEESGYFSLLFRQPGLLRPLSGRELSDGTLRFLLLATALHTPRPSELMILNEPETSLHPDLIPALAGSISAAAENSQVWVITHSDKLVKILRSDRNANLIELEKVLGETKMVGQKQLERPPWHWPK